MYGSLFILISALRLIALQKECYTHDDNYYQLPHFWTNVGLYPAGNINHKDITNSLTSPSMLMNLQHIAALPTGAVTHVRIHWLLELIEFVQFTQSGTPIYDFTELDKFLENLDDLSLSPVVEFMANPGEVFEKNPSHNDFYWQDFVYQVTKHYLNLFGATKVLNWKFETWNEPDLVTYNLLNFTIDDYFNYITALRSGLTEAGHRSTNSLYFPLRGPAGLFKEPSKHPLCWKVLEYCALFPDNCPVDVLTYHRKGAGHALEVITASSELLHKMYAKYPTLRNYPVSNDEADPSSGWSLSQESNADVRYANTLVRIVMEHWDAKLRKYEFHQLETISHDNAFLSYHPHEFTQRTLLAHLRMNETNPPHAQFIQKPVYAALGLLSKLGTLAAPIETLHTLNGHEIKIFKTTAKNDGPLYLSWLFASEEQEMLKASNFTFKRTLSFGSCNDEQVAYIAELLAQKQTDPYHVWLNYGAPAYPNATVRNAMRQQQAPIVHAKGDLSSGELTLNLNDLNMPWLVLLRACAISYPKLKQPQQLTLTAVTTGEILITWRELKNTAQCLQTYEIWFSAHNASDWWQITTNTHIPFPIFQHAPADRSVNGFYKVRGMDLFNRPSLFSEIVEYYEI